MDNTYAAAQKLLLVLHCLIVLCLLPPEVGVPKLPKVSLLRNLILQSHNLDSTISQTPLLFNLDVLPNFVDDCPLKACGIMSRL